MTVLVLALFLVAALLLVPAIATRGPSGSLLFVSHPIAALQDALRYGPQVGRVQSDFRTMGGGLEAYTVDTGPYPSATALPDAAPATPTSAAEGPCRPPRPPG